MRPVNRRVAASLISLLAAGCSCGPGTGECTGGSTRSCPLSLGVCAGSVATCVDGHWSTCDYGPDYQLTERRCDGLDNDCDGTIDSSWTRVLLEADAGRFGALMGSDVELANVVPETKGHWLSLPNDLLMIDDDLGVTGRTRFPVLLNGWAFVFPNRGDWLRIAQDFSLSDPRARVLFHGVFADGGFELEADGGARLVAEVVLPPHFFGLRAAAVDGGWVAAASASNWPQPSELWAGQWTMLQLDGGLTSNSFDAGGMLAGKYNGLDARGATFLAWSRTATDTLEVFDADLATSTLRPRLAVSGDCWLTRVAPLTVGCRGSPFTWLDESGARLHASATWGALWQHEDGDHLLAMSPAPDWDGGGPPPPLLLGELRDGGVVQFLKVAGAPVSPYLRVHELGGRLVLVTWGEYWGAGVCPTCELGRFVARYACLPP